MEDTGCSVPPLLGGLPFIPCTQPHFGRAGKGKVVGAAGLEVGSEGRLPAHRLAVPFCSALLPIMEF